MSRRAALWTRAAATLAACTASAPFSASDGDRGATLPLGPAGPPAAQPPRASARDATATSTNTLVTLARSLLPTAGWLCEAHAEAPPPPPPPPRPPRLSLQEAYAASILAPLSYYLEGPPLGLGPPSEGTLEAVEAAALAALAAASEQPRQVVALAWALAWAGHAPSQPYLDRLHAAAAAGALPGGPPLDPAHRAVLLWCAAMHGAVPPAAWEAGLRGLAASASTSAANLGECALQYLLHASLLVAADAATVDRRAAGSRASPSSPTAASAAAAAAQPRATREEVLAAAAPLGRALSARLAVAYGESVPLHPAVEGPYLALLFVLEQLAAAAGAAAGAGLGSSGAQTTAWLPPGVAEAAAATLRSGKDLARIKRDLLYHWRGDSLVDATQRVRNQVVFLLTRRLGVTVAQPEDVDVVIPSHWLALYVRPPPAAAAAAAPLPYGGSPGPGAFSAYSPGAAGHGLTDAVAEGLELLRRERFAPHVSAQAQLHQTAAAAREAGGSAGGGSGAAWGAPGMWAARTRQLRRLGWRTVVVDGERWAALGSDAAREAYLQSVLRGGGGGGSG